MFLEKFSRFVRLYDVRFSPRHQGAACLPLNAANENYSIRDALGKKVGTVDAVVATTNGDLIELMSATYDAHRRCLVLLFHRASPNAAEPAYRRKAIEKAGRKVTVRRGTKGKDEEQAVSAHLVIYDKPIKAGLYRAALEEIPGLSMSMIRQIITTALMDYPYDFVRKAKRLSTHCVFKPEGVKSESLTNALKKGEINYVTLSKPPVAPFVDAGGLFQPMRQQLRLRVIGEIDGETWGEKLSKMVGLAKEDGWEDFTVDIALDNSRKKTVKLDREQAAKEVLFVRSEEVNLKTELSPCSTEVVGDLVEAFRKVIFAS